MILEEQYSLKKEQVNEFQSNGWISLKNVLDQTNVETFRQHITETVTQQSKDVLPLHERDTYDKAFLQIHNLWQLNDKVKDFVLAKRFGKIAADLLGVKNVRLYHDQALYKEPGGGKTPWHQDQYYWPIDTSNTITMWMPLIDLSEEMGILQFASGTHQTNNKKSVAISDESEAHFSSLVKENKIPVSDIKSYNAGDASFHYGWTMHYAPGNFSSKMREVMTIIYVADDAKVIEPQHDAHRFDLNAWMPGLKSGDLVSSPLNPLIL